MKNPEGLAIYKEATALLKRAQRLKKEATIGVDEAVFQPNPEYPNLPIALVLMTDIHYGSIKTNYNLLEEHLNVIENTPNMYMISNGDNVDNFNAIFFQSGIFENPLPPQLQTMAIIERLGRLAEKGKIGVISYGNHDEFVEDTGYSWLETFAKDLHVPVFTSGGYLHVLHGKQDYGIGMWHRYFGTSKLNPTNANKRLLDFEYPQADIVFLGHTHQSEVLHFEKGGRERIAVIGGTYKTDNDDYARKRGIAGRAGKPGHTVFLWPGIHKMAAFKDFDIAREFMTSLIFEEEEKQ